MYTPINLREVTDRVLGLSPPRVPMAARLPRPWDRQMGFVLMVVSALVSLACAMLWIEGDTIFAVRLFGGTVIALAIALRLI